MNTISLVVFDLSRTTVEDGTAVQDCLYEAARSFELPVTRAEVTAHLGMNKIHLFQYFLERSRGRDVSIEDMEKFHQKETQEQARQIFDHYETLMFKYYAREVKPIPGAEETFHWLHEQGIKIATDTGFHENITQAIMNSLGWLDSGLIDACVHVESIPGQRGRPAPFMIFRAMEELNIQSVHEVIKVGDTSADMLAGFNAGCRGFVGVLTGHQPIAEWGRYRHTHIIPSVMELPDLMETNFL